MRPGDKTIKPFFLESEGGGEELSCAGKRREEEEVCLCHTSPVVPTRVDISCALPRSRVETTSTAAAAVPKDLASRPVFAHVAGELSREMIVKCNADGQEFSPLGYCTTLNPVFNSGPRKCTRVPAASTRRLARSD